MTDAILIKLAQYQTETRNQKKELKTYSQKLLDREEEIKRIGFLEMKDKRRWKDFKRMVEDIGKEIPMM